MGKPTWIVFEGIDGSGKTTQARLLNEYLNQRGLKCRYKHVFDSSAGRLLREMFISNAFSNTVEILILCATRQAFLDDLGAEEADCDVIIVDRFFLSILAMQGRNDTDVNLINYIADKVCGARERPIVFHLNTSPEVCKGRLRNRRVQDRIEGKDVEFHRAVYERYSTLLAAEDNVYQFDGDADIEKVHRTIVDTAVLLLGITEPIPT